MNDENDALRAQAVASLKRKRKFWGDALLYGWVNGALWLIWALTDRTTDNSIPWPAWVSIIWGLLLVADAVRAFSPWLRGSFTAADVDREMRRLAPH